ncbi:ATP-binding protein [Streptomyces niveus]|uniref:ATP-binding protein n=1 Tax=Streptomyces niveus TaxID=193462 RepID=UPI003414FA23
MNERIQVQRRARGAQPRPEDACRVGVMRRIATARLRHCRLTALIEEVSLVVSELVTNAVLHTTTSEIRVTIAIKDGFLIITVIDGMPGRATLKRADEAAESGRGLSLVAVVAEEHGGAWGTNGTGSETWCRLKVPVGMRP